jgi:2,3-bisphosphoglycerate-independent phosphoglycerate mutase
MIYNSGLDLVKELVVQTPSKIVLLVADGLGGLPHPDTGRTELETARTPNLDRLAREGLCGLTYPVAPGITPGSGPGHLALFGYDPLVYNIGRGILEALGSDMEVGPQDVAVRGNFCTVDAQGRIVDRRAGRISSARTADLCARLQEIRLDGVELRIKPGREHRFAMVLRGPTLSDALTDSDPQREGLRPLEVQALTEGAQGTALVANSFVAQARQILRDAGPANMLLLRGFSKPPDIPPFPQLYKLRAAAVAAYPMYRGLAKLVGMELLPTGETVEDELQTVTEKWQGFEYFFVHVKGTDSAGEDGDFARKVQVIEAIDGALPALLSLEPDVLVVTGDHSTPAVMAPMNVRMKSMGSTSTSATATSVSFLRAKGGGRRTRWRGPSGAGPANSQVAFARQTRDRGRLPQPADGIHGVVGVLQSSRRGTSTSMEE